MDEKQNKRKNRSDDDRQNPVFLMVHKTVENNHFYCGLLLLMFMSIVTGYCSVRPEIPIYLGNIMKIYAIVSGMGFIISLAMAALDIIICALEFVNNLRLNLQDEGEHKNEEYNEKTYIGIYIGDLPIQILTSYKESTGQLINSTMNNPAIFVPELKKIIYGCESWWKTIRSVDEFSKISNEDINNTWYVKLLQSMDQPEEE